MRNPCATPPPSSCTEQAKRYAATIPTTPTSAAVPPSLDTPEWTAVVPPWMKAAVRTGKDSELVFNRKYPSPQPTRGKVLLQVKAAAINNADYAVPKGVLGPVAGIDVAGIVIAIGENGEIEKIKEEGTQKIFDSSSSYTDVVDPELSQEPSTPVLRVGDAVFGTAQGALAEFVLADVDALTLKPAALTFPEAAAMPTSYLSGIQALRDHGKMRPGARVMVIGASGGCGLAGVQVRS